MNLKINRHHDVIMLSTVAFHEHGATSGVWLCCHCDQILNKNENPIIGVDISCAIPSSISETNITNTLVKKSADSIHSPVVYCMECVFNEFDEIHISELVD